MGVNPACAMPAARQAEGLDLQLQPELKIMLIKLAPVRSPGSAGEQVQKRLRYSQPAQYSLPIVSISAICNRLSSSDWVQLILAADSQAKKHHAGRGGTSSQVNDFKRATQKRFACLHTDNTSLRLSLACSKSPVLQLAKWLRSGWTERRQLG